jgi:hypothetical protein
VINVQIRILSVGEWEPISVRVQLNLYSSHTKLAPRGFAQSSVIALPKYCAGRDITVCGEQGDNEYRLSASLNFNAKRF